MAVNAMPNPTKRPRMTSARFLTAHRRALETLSDLYEAIEEMPVLAAADPTTMKQYFDDLASVQATAVKLSQHLRTDTCTKEKISNSF